MELNNVPPQLWLIGNLAATWYLVGLIWLIQVVHYPLFSQVGQENFVVYEKNHADRITPIVAIPMLIELITAVMLCYFAPEPIDRRLMWVGLGLAVLVWLSTAFIQVPCHTRLGRGFDESAYRMLVMSNWLRTIAWTTRGCIMSYACWQVMSRTSA